MPFTPIKGTWADPDEVVCRDCIYRDHTTVKLPSGKIVDAGITRLSCAVYLGKPDKVISEYMPEDCKYYKKETYKPARPYIDDMNEDAKCFECLRPNLKFPLPCEAPAKE